VERHRQSHVVGTLFHRHVAHGVTVPRLEHGDEEWTWPLIADALRRGLATRVGFEDSVLLPDGSVAQDNAALVASVVALRDTEGTARPQ
jgi:uncharacterized protein (DUF849 family)